MKLDGRQIQDLKRRLYALPKNAHTTRPDTYAWDITSFFLTASLHLNRQRVFPGGVFDMKRLLRE
jgi:hypothetical protein